MTQDKKYVTKPQPSSNQSFSPELQQLPVVSSENYIRQDEVGRGGLGRIVQAKDTRLERTVALKELLLTQEDTQRRFIREAKITAKLQHPSIIPVYEAGRWPSGEPFFAMKLVHGRGFDQVMSEKITFAERLSLLPSMIGVCEALAYAHHQKIIHRDLKPANILFGDFGEIVVIDWGIAKELNEESINTIPDKKEDDLYSSRVNIKALGDGHNLTLTGSVVGTPAYMPPEQAQGKPVDERADVYALGVILYELLSGTQPYQGRTSQEILIKLTQAPPEPLEKKEPKTPKDLVAIVKKAMARDPVDRYPTARELAKDLEKFQTGQLVDVYKYSLQERFRRWFQQNKLTVAVASFLLLVLFFVSGYLLGGLIEKEREAQAARLIAEGKNKELIISQKNLLEEQKNTQAALDRVNANNNRMIMAEAQRALEIDPTMALAWLKDLSPNGRYFDTARLVAVSALNRGIAYRAFFGPKGPLKQVAFSSSLHFMASINEEKRLSLWNIKEQKELELPEVFQKSLFATFSQDESMLLVTTQDRVLHSFDLKTKEEKPFIEQSLPDFGSFTISSSLLVDLNPKLGARLWSMTSKTPQVIREDPKIAYTAAELSADGNSVALARNDHIISLFDTKTLQVVKQLQGHLAAVSLLRFSPDGSKFASASTDKTIRIWSLTSDGVVVLTENSSDLIDLRFSPNGKKLASVGKDNIVRLWDTSTGVGIPLSGAYNDASSLRFSSDGRWLAFAGRDGLVWLRDTVTNQELSLVGHIEPVLDINFSLDSKEICSIDEAGELRCWDLSLLPNRTVSLYQNPIQQMTLTAKGDKLALGYQDGTIKVFYLDTGKTQTINLLTRPVSVVKVSPDGKWLAAGSQGDGTILIWDLSINTGLLIGLPLGPEAIAKDGGIAAVSLDFSSDSEWLAFVDSSRDLKLLTLKPGNLSNAKQLLSGVTVANFSPNGPTIAYGNREGLFTLDLRFGKTHKVSKEAIYNQVLRYSPKGELLATQNAVWSMNKEEMLSLKGYGDVSLAEFSPDGSWLITSGKSKTIQLWDLKKQSLALELEGHSDMVTGVALSKDRDYLISTSRDKTVRLWDTETKNWVALGRFRDGLNMLIPLQEGFLSGGDDGFVRRWQIEPAPKEDFTKWVEQKTTMIPSTE